YDLLAESAARNASETALEFMGRRIQYARLHAEIRRTAKALIAAGIGRGDVVTICMPNCPQAVYLFYAINRIGAVANMVHPLSAPEEIAFYLNDSNSRMIATLDLFVHKLDVVAGKLSRDLRVVVSSIGEELAPLTAVGYYLTRKKPESTACSYIRWKDFLKGGESGAEPPVVMRGEEEPAVILYSGGTTGVNKGILLSDRNFNACALQTFAMSGYYHTPDLRGFKMLAVMPVFHGFGLCICIHMSLVKGIECILLPQFSLKTYADTLLKKKPNFIVGVPTLFEALLRSEKLRNADLSYLKGVFSGGDSLSVELKRKADDFLAAHGSPVPIREGYGTTECVTASCLTPLSQHREGSIGIPFPDTYYTIVRPGTTEPLAAGEEGEICISGPSVMLGYNHNETETAEALRVHADGRTWLHTGDLGRMDEDGFVYFCQRIKRMIITSGYNVYPSRVENVLDAHPDVLLSCVIGVKDDYKMQRIKAFVVLREGVVPSDEVKERLLDHCRLHLACYA
ncbi:MAG: AMP-binding protein, partial [Clostridia bacterium]|nr:AMP-binding protein [Clostridia bacterium]